MDPVIIAGLIITVITVIPVILQIGKHPKGLRILFFAEMWERFSYYGMRGILVFYLTEHFLFSQEKAQGEYYASYTSLVYLLPLFGGILADRYLGNRKAIAYGALLLVAGHLAMAIEQKPARETVTFSGVTYQTEAQGRMEARQSFLILEGERYAYKPIPVTALDKLPADASAAQRACAAPAAPAADAPIEAKACLAVEGLPATAAIPSLLPAGSYTLAVEGRDPLFVNILFVALALIAVGVGFLKGNISAIVGQLYPESDVRRDPGFTLYYYGINLGAFWAGILCGFLALQYGWAFGFGAAGIGMILGWLVFVAGKPLLEGKGEPPNPQALAKPVFGPLNGEALIYLGGLIAVGLVFLLIQSNQIVGYLLGGMSLLSLAYLVWYMGRNCTAVETQRMILALLLTGVSVLFWTLFEQAGSSLNIFARDHTNLAVTNDIAMTASQTQSFNSGFILLLAPAFAGLWTFLGARNLDPNPSMKFGLALVQVGLSFLILVWGGQYAGPELRIPLFFLAFAYLVQTTGELFLSPVGLSMISKLSVPALLSSMMAVWFLSSSWAQYLGGAVARLTSVDTIGGQAIDRGAAFAQYLDVYGTAGWVTIGIGVGLIALSPLLNRLAHGVR